MKVAKSLFSICILFIFLIGCNNSFADTQAKGNPTPEEFLENEGADIFVNSFSAFIIASCGFHFP